MLVVTGFEHGYHRQEAHEQQQKGCKQTDCAKEQSCLGQGRAIASANRWQMVRLETTDNDREAVEPDADTDGEPDEDTTDGALTCSLELEQLRSDDAVDDRGPVKARIVSGDAAEGGLLNHRLGQQGRDDLVEVKIG